MNRRRIDMLQGPLFGNLIFYTIPIILTGVLQLLFNAADLIVVGWYCGSISVGAISATGAITNLIVNLFIGLSVGSGVTVAHALGSRKDNEVHRIVHTTLPVALVSGAVLTVIGVIFSESFLRMMSTPENVLPLSAAYMRIYFAGITFSMVYNFCSAILRAAGDTKGPLLYLTIAGIANVIMNVVFVAVFHMNVSGVALATTLSQGIAAFLVVRALMHRQDACKLDLHKLRFYKPEFIRMVKIGLPAGIQGSLFSISNVIIQSSINSFSSDALIAGNGAGSSIDGFLFTAMNAFHQTAVNFVGQNAGAQQYKRIKKIVLLCMLCVTVLGLAAGNLIYLFGENLLSIYITDSPEAIQMGMIRLSYIAVPYFVCGLQDLLTGALRGLGSSVYPMIISVLGICGLRIVWIYTVFRMPQYHTPQCLYFSYLLSWIVTFIFLLATFLFILHRRIRQAQLA